MSNDSMRITVKHKSQNILDNLPFNIDTSYRYKLRTPLNYVIK